MWKNVYDVYIENNIEKEIQEWVNSLNLKQNNNWLCFKIVLKLA